MATLDQGHRVAAAALLVVLAMCSGASSSLAASKPPSAPATVGAYVSCLDDPEGQLVIGDGRPLALRPGASGRLTLRCRRCCWIDEDVAAKVTWSLQPPGMATLAPTGDFTLGAQAAVGSRLVAVGELSRGGRKLRAQAEILVIDPSAQPWAGRWREVAQLPCSDAPAKPAPTAPTPMIEELELHEDGTFAVTWLPFERYQDYWGTYTVDRQSGALRLEVTGGNHVPEELDLAGTLRIDNSGEMVLSDVFLGRPSNASYPAACGHRFRR